MLKQASVAESSNQTNNNLYAWIAFWIYKRKDVIILSFQYLFCIFNLGFSTFVTFKEFLGLQR